MRFMLLRCLLLVTTATLVLHARAQAQIRASELGATQQTVDGTKITIEYSRPAVRGRTPFGGVVHWGEKWTPGANWATTLEVDRDIRLAGREVPKGKYSLWVVPRQDQDWTLIVHKKARAYHTQRPDTTSELLRIAVKPESASHLERLTFSFPTVTPEGTVLRFHWGTTAFEVPIRVHPSKPVALDAATIRQLSGIYQFRWRGDVRMEVFAAGERLRARMEPSPLPFDATFDLLPLAKNRFAPFFYRSGQPFDTEDFVVMFDAEDGARATAVSWLGINDQVITKGGRVK